MGEGDYDHLRLSANTPPAPTATVTCLVIDIGTQIQGLLLFLVVVSGARVAEEGRSRGEDVTENKGSGGQVRARAEGGVGC